MIALTNRGKAIAVSALVGLAGIWLVGSQLTSIESVPASAPSPTPHVQSGYFLSDYSPTAAPQPSAVGIDPGDLFGVLWKTALVIALLYLSLRGLRWLQSRNLRSSPVPISVLASAPLEPGKRLLVVDVAGRVLVIATTGASVTLLTELSAPPKAGRSDFQDFLKDHLTPTPAREPRA